MLHQQESDDSDSYVYGYGYIDDLIQFARERLDQQPHRPIRDNEDSSKPTSRQSRTASRSNSRSRSRARCKTSSKPNSRSNSKSMSIPSSKIIRSNGSRSPPPSSKIPSGWDIKRSGMEEDSDSGTSSHDYSDSETQTIAANEVSASDAVKSSLHNPELPIVDAFAAEPIDSTDVPASAIDVSLLPSIVLESVDSIRTSNDFSPALSDVNHFVILSEVTESESGPSRELSPASLNNEETNLSTNADTTIRQSNNDFSPASPDNQNIDLSATAATEIGPSNGFSPASRDNQNDNLSATETRPNNDFSSASLDNNELIDTPAGTKIEPSYDSSPALLDMQPLDLSKTKINIEPTKVEINLEPTKAEIDLEPMDLSVKPPVLNLTKKKSSNIIASLSTSTRWADMSSTCTIFENSIDVTANSSLEETDASTAAIPSVLQERSNGNNESATSTRPTGVNRKRSIPAAGTTQSDDENSSATANRPQQTDPDESPIKKSMHHTAVPETVTREIKIREKSVTNTKPTARKSTDAIVKPPLKETLKLDKQIPSETRARKEKDTLDLFKSEAIPPNPGKSLFNENIEKKKRKIDLKSEKINKKAKICVKVEDTNDSKNIFKKNRIKQFKVILKIMKSRSEGWTLSELNDLDSNNFCDAIHHFEKPSDGISSLVEIKIFDSSSKANKINYKNLFGDEFNIQKYFATFCKFEHTCFSNEHSKLFIYTNRDVDEALFRNNGITVTNQNRQYTFKVGEPYEKTKIYRKCLEYFELPKLAELLNECISNADKLAHFNMELMKKYHLALVNERVLVLTDEKQKVKAARVAKFHTNFIDNCGLSDAAKELRRHLVDRHCEPTKNMQFRVGNKDFGKAIPLTIFEETVDKLPNENCKKTFEHFFEVFQIIGIDERELAKTVVNELGQEFLKIDETIYSDAVQEELLIFLKNNGLNSNLLEPLKHTISKLNVTEKILKQTNPQLNVEFGKETFSSLLREIGTQDIILCSTESLVLSDLKMRQFSKNNSYLENQHSLFITDEILFSMSDDVVKALTHRLTNLLVILWKNNVVTNTDHAKQIEEVMKRLRKVITETSNAEKSVVIIASKENINLSLSQYQFTRIDDDLTLTSQSEFFKSTTIFLQDRKLKLVDLADHAAINSLVRSPKMLEKFLSEQMKIGRELVKPLGFREKLFDFKLKQRVVIDPKIFQEKINDVFVIRNINSETFFRDYKPSDLFVSVTNFQPSSYELPSNARFILLDSQVNPTTVNNKIKGSNIHLLSYESHNFIWKSTIGSIATLLKFKRNANEACNAPSTIEDILRNGSKTMLISGESGMGKSVCLYNIAKISNELCHVKSESSNPIWHVQVNLDQPLENTLRGYPIKTPENAIHFLADYLDLRDEQKDLFIMSAQGRLKLKLMLFVDGYDDANENIDLMTNLLRFLKDTCVQRIFVASKTDKLEEVLETCSYSIQFGNEERTHFVEKLGAKIDLTSKDKLLITPLHLNMFVELCQTTPEKISIDNHYDLYKSYVNLILPSDQLKNAYNLSAQKLLNEKELEESGAMIENVNLDIPEQLSHRTITEFFVAKCLSRRRHRGTKKCVNNLIDRTSSIFLSSYLAARSAKNKNVSIDEYAEHGHLSFLKAMMAIDDSNKPCLKRLIRKGKNNTLEVLRFLLEHYNDTGCRDFVQSGKYVNSDLAKYVDGPVDGQTPLQIAVECEKIDLACELMLKGADVSVLNSQSGFVMKAATYAIRELMDGNERLGPVAAILLEKSPQVTADLDNETQLPKILAYLFSRGYPKLVEELLNVRNISERNQLLENPINGKSLLAHVNESRFLTDEARQSLILYLVKNTHSNLLRNNIDSILHHACLSGHEHTFNYFMHPTKTSIEILHQALRSNDMRVVEFLMRDSKRTIDSNGNTALHQAIVLQVSRKTINFLLGKVGINDKNNSGETALHLAFKEGANLSLIKFLINAGASITITNNLGFYPWVFALKEESSRYCKMQQLELFNFLSNTSCLTFPNCRSKSLDFDMTRKEVLPKLNYFANPSNFNLNFNSNGDSRLHSALPNKDEKYWCIFLINRGAEVNVKKDGKFAFHVALDNQRFDVAKLMLQHGAIIDQLDQYKNTPLDYLTSRPRDVEGEKMVKLLNFAIGIFAGRVHDFNSVLNVNSSNIDFSEFRYLLNCRNKRGRTLLHMAASMSKPEIIEHLYKLSRTCEMRYKDFKPMNVNAVDEHGNTPLHLAARQVNADCAEKLLAIGAKFRMRNSDVKQPIDLSSHGSPGRKLLRGAEDLFKHVEKGDVKEVRKILNQKGYSAVQHARDDSGKTPLYFVKNEKMMKFLLADVNVVDENERPPIYYAAEENDLGRVKLLLKAGTNYDFKGFREGYNESFELLKRIDEIFEDMHSHEPKFFVEGNPWAFNKELDDISRIFGVARDIVVNTKDSQRNNLLHYAAKYNYVEVAENLLKNGAIYNSRNKCGKTPEDLAISKGIFKSVNDLFANLDVNSWENVDTNLAINCRMSGGYTLLHKAVENGCYETVKWLVDKGADVKATGNNSVGVRVDNYPEIARLLKKKQ